MTANASSGYAVASSEGWLSGGCCCCRPGWQGGGGGGGRPEAATWCCVSRNSPGKRLCSWSCGSLPGCWQGWGELGAGLVGSSPLPGPGTGSMPVPLCVVELWHKPDLCKGSHVYGLQTQSEAQPPFGAALLSRLCLGPPGFPHPTPQQRGVKAASCLPLQPGLGGVRAHPSCSASDWAQFLLPALLLAVQHKPAGPECASGLGAGLHGQGHRGFHPG